MNKNITTIKSRDDIVALLGEEETRSLLDFSQPRIGKDQLHLPGPDWVDRQVATSDRPVRVLRSLQTLFDHGRLGGSGYLSILPVDQGIEHSAGASSGREACGVRVIEHRFAVVSLLGPHWQGGDESQALQVLARHRRR